MAFFLGIDGGGSKTECALADEAGVVLVRATGAGANLRRLSRVELSATLRDCLERLRWTAGLPALSIEAVCAGFAGAGDAGARERAREVLTELLRPRCLYVVGDMEVALEAAVGAGPGVVLIAGTGSIAYGRNGQGQQARAGGHGPGESDEGSGYDIGRRALEAARGARGSEALAEVVRAAHLSESPSATDLATLVPGVVRAARRGDRTAKDILQQAAEALTGLALTVLRELSLLDTEVQVATSGGVFAESEEVFAGVRSRIASAAPQAGVAPLAVTPAEGAVRLAQRLWLQEQAAG